MEHLTDLPEDLIEMQQELIQVTIYMHRENPRIIRAFPQCKQRKYTCGLRIFPVYMYTVLVHTNSGELSSVKELIQAKRSCSGNQVLIHLKVHPGGRSKLLIQVISSSCSEAKVNPGDQAFIMVSKS